MRPKTLASRRARPGSPGDAWEVSPGVPLHGSRAPLAGARGPPGGTVLLVAGLATELIALPLSLRQMLPSLALLPPWDSQRPVSYELPVASVRLAQRQLIGIYCLSFAQQFFPSAHLLLRSTPDGQVLLYCSSARTAHTAH